MSVPILVEFRRDTPRAILVHLDNAPVWLPKSQIENWNNTLSWTEGEEVTLILSNWIARQKGITSNTTPDDSPINEEKWQVLATETGEGRTVHFVMSEGVEWCRCDDPRIATMIAAALTLTDGKV